MSACVFDVSGHHQRWWAHAQRHVHRAFHPQAALQRQAAGEARTTVAFDTAIYIYMHAWGVRGSDDVGVVSWTRTRSTTVLVVPCCAAEHTTCVRG